MAIIKCLDLCTSHVTVKDQAKLDDEHNCFADVGPRKSNHEYGWIIFLGHPEQVEEFSTAAKRAGMSKAFCDVIKYALKRKCSLIQFDRDADIIPGLPTFEW